MRPRSILYVVAVLLTAVVVAGPAAHAGGAPAEAVVFLEIRDVTAFDAKLMALARQSLPLVGAFSLAGMLPQRALKTQDPSSVNLAEPLQMVLLAPPLHKSPVLVFSVTDAGRYLDSLPPSLTEEREEDGVHVYFDDPFEEDAAWAETDWDVEGEETTAIAIVGTRAVVGADVEAVKAVADLLREGKLAADAAFPAADAAALVRLKTLLAGLAEQGEDPFQQVRMTLQMSAGMMPATGGMDPMAALESYVDAAESLAGQLDVLSMEVVLGPADIGTRTRVVPVAGSTLAAYTAGLSREPLALAKYLPDDPVLFCASKVGDVSPLMSWYGDVMTAMLGGAGEPAIEQFIGDMTGISGLLGDEMAMALSLTPQSTFLVTAAVRTTDPAAMEGFLAPMSQNMAAMSEMQAQMGMRMDVAYTPASTTYQGHEIALWEFDYEFGTPAGMAGAMPMDLAAVQEAAVTAFWGEDPTGYSTFVGDVQVFAQGVGALEAVKAAIDAPETAAALPDSLAPALSAGDQAPVMVATVSVERFAEAYLRIVTQAVAKAGTFVPPILGQLKFQSGAPMALAAWTAEDGTVTTQCYLPISVVANISQGVQRAMFGMMQQQNMPEALVPAGVEP